MAMKTNFKVAYILDRFPYLTETFVAREIDWIRSHDVDITIFSLLSSKDSLVHTQSKALLPLTHYSPYISWSVLQAQRYFLQNASKSYFRALTKLIRQNYREPKVLLRGLILFPKSVYFARKIQELGCDHIHTHFVWLGAMAASIVNELTGISFSVRPHAFGLFQRDQQDVRRTLENVSQIITVSTYHQAYIANLVPKLRADQVSVVYYGLETDTVVPRPEKTTPLVPTILSIGRTVEKKGHEYLVAACGLLAQRGIKFRCLIVVGFDEDTPQLQSLIDETQCEEFVTLLDYQTQDEIVNLYHECDIFALACVIAKDGDRDGLPNVIVEAMACGLPVVTTPVAGIPDLVMNDVNGLLVEERNSEAMADGLERLIHNVPLQYALGEKARQSVLDQCDIRHTTKIMADIMKEVK